MQLGGWVAGAGRTWTCQRMHAGPNWRAVQGPGTHPRKPPGAGTTWPHINQMYNTPENAPLGLRTPSCRAYPWAWKSEMHELSPARASYGGVPRRHCCPQNHSHHRHHRPFHPGRHCTRWEGGLQGPCRSLEPDPMPGRFQPPSAAPRQRQ